MQTIIKQLTSSDSFIVDIKKKDFEGRRITSGDSVRSGVPLTFFCEDNYEELFGRGGRGKLLNKKRSTRSK